MDSNVFVAWQAAEILLENSKNDEFEGASPLTGFKIIACRPFYAVDVLSCRWANQYFSSLLD